MNDEVRSYAVAMQPDLINCAVCAFKAGKTQVDTVRVLFREISTYMIKCMKSELDPEMLMAFVSSMRTCIEHVDEIAAQCLDQNALMTIGEALFK